MKKKNRLKPFIPFLIILIITISVYIFIYFHPQTWDSLRYFYLILKDFNTHHPIVTPFLFIISYILYTVLMLPGIALLALISGFLFPQPFSTLYVIIAATIGSSLLFFTARTAFREILSQYSSPLIKRLERGFRKDATNYMLFLRLIPLFPFKIVNLAGAFFGVPFMVFALTTFIGMIPSVFVYTEAGKGISSYLDYPNLHNIWNLFHPSFIIALTSLALLSLLLILIKNRAK